MISCAPESHDLELVSVNYGELTYRCRKCNEEITQYDEHSGG